jgi:hypothetical protein
MKLIKDAGEVGFGDARPRPDTIQRTGLLHQNECAAVAYTLTAAVAISSSTGSSWFGERGMIASVFSMRSLTMCWPSGAELSEKTSSGVRGPSRPSDS